MLRLSCSSFMIAPRASLRPRGGSSSRSWWRCRGDRLRRTPASTSPAVACASTSRPGSRLARGQHGRDARVLDQVGARAQRQDRLGVAVLVLDELQRVADVAELSTAALPPGTATASNSTDGMVSSVTSTSSASPSAVRTRAEARARRSAARRPARVSASCSACAAAPSTPSATRIAMRRVADAAVAGPREQGQRRRRVRPPAWAPASAPSASARASPCPARAASVSARSAVDVGQHRHHALADGRRPAPWSARSGSRGGCAPSRSGVWLFQNSVAWV